jgi:hypothetical protein
MPMRRYLHRLALGVVGTSLFLFDAARALAGFGAPFAVAPDRDAVGSGRRDRASPEGPAQRYGQLEPDACQTELTRRGGSFTLVEGARGVVAPIRLTGPLHGVSFHSAVPASKRPTSPWEILDCRLALALDDFAAQLGSHDVVEVIHYSMYRPPSADWPADRPARQHGGAVAIDVASFLKKDGTKLDVERDFHGQIGATTCGPAAGPTLATPEALELRQIVCDAADAKLFNVVLTPDYNRAHYNHFHLEVAAGLKWFVVR